MFYWGWLGVIYNLVYFDFRKIDFIKFFNYIYFLEVNYFFGFFNKEDN